MKYNKCPLCGSTNVSEKIEYEAASFSTIVETVDSICEICGTFETRWEL